MIGFRDGFASKNAGSKDRCEFSIIGVPTPDATDHNIPEDTTRHCARYGNVGGAKEGAVGGRNTRKRENG